MDTVKQEEVGCVAESGNSRQNDIKAITVGSETQALSNDRSPLLRQMSGKPVSEHAVTEVTSPSRSDQVDFSPRSKRRPSATSAFSSQRPKRRVIWKGKACTIAFPSDDERGRRPLLYPSDVAARLQQWQNEGWDTRGFKLSSSPASEEIGVQTCGLHPDPVYVMQERERGQFRVNVPNQAEWDAYVDFLKEEKLRALGVTLSDNGPPRTTQSPLPPSLSRASLGLPGQSLSPLVPLPSGASNIPALTGSSYSPVFHASNTSSRVGSAAPYLPHFPPSRNGMHHSNKSLAHPGMGPRMISPFNQDPSRPGPSLQQALSPSAYYVQSSERVLPSAGALQRSRQVQSPVSPLKEEIDTTQSNALLAQMRRHQESQSRFVPPRRHQRSYTETAPFDPLPTPALRQSAAHEIVQPAPQGHQRNISEALQREIDAAEEALLANEHLGYTGMAATASNVMEKPPSIDHSSSLQRNGETKEPIKSEPYGHPANLPAATVEPVSGEHREAEKNVNEAYLGDLSSSTEQTMHDLRHTKQSLPLQRVNGASGHKATASMSKLNVRAEEFKFNPKGKFPSPVFVFSGESIQSSLPSTASSFSNSGSHKATLPKSTMATGLNADAPTFTPSTFRKSDFQFSSAIFNVDAPAFNPGRFVSENLSDQNTEGNSIDAAQKIFSQVTIDTNGKAMRRGKVSKALPIRQPDDEEHTEDDEDGRVQVSAARQKRARVQNIDGDDIPFHAISGPSRDNGAQIMSEIASESTPPLIGDNEDNAQFSSPDTSSIICTDEVDHHKQSITEDSCAEAVQAPMETHVLSSQPESSIAQEERELATSFSPREDDVAGDMMNENGEGADHPSGHNSEVSLSAVPLSDAADEKLSDSSSLMSKPRKSAGLEASRHAATPPSSPPATDMRMEPPAQHSVSERSNLSTSSDPAEKTEQDYDRACSNDESRDSTTHHTAREDFTDDIEKSAPPSGGLSSGSSNAAEQDCAVPSYDEIDAVMKQFEDNSDLGVERVETPPMSLRPSGGLFLNPSINIRSDAPSPSPTRTLIRLEPVHELTETRTHMNHSPPGIDTESRYFSTNHDKGAEISDWNDALSVADEGKFKSRTHFFDAHVDSIVGDILEDHLGPLRGTLQTIQHSIALLAAQRPLALRRTSTSDDMKHSDADDEDEETKTESMVLHRSRSPINQKRDRRSDIIKTAVTEALVAFKQDSLSPREMGQSSFEQLLSEVRSLKDSSTSKQRPDEIKTIVEEVISTHPRLRGKRVQDDHQAGAAQKFSLQIDGLESMLKVANERAEEEYRARREVEDDLADTNRRLNHLAEEAAQYREAAEEAEHSLSMYYVEKESMQDLEQTNSELLLKNAALETTLEEYRLSHDQWRIDMEDERERSRDLKAALRPLRREVEDNLQIKQGLRAKLERLQEDMADVMERVGHDQASWIRKEHDLSAKNKELDDELYRGARLRQKMELELDELDKKHREVSKFRDAYAVAQNENGRLEALVGQLRIEARTHEDVAHGLQRDVDHLREIAGAEVSRMRSTYEHDIGLMESQHNLVSANLQAQVSRLQTQLQQTRDDADETKSKHQAHLTDHIDRHGQALHEVNETKEAALADQRRSHEKAINDLRERHARALHNASDDKYRLEAHTMEKIALSDDKIQHLEGKVVDLQQRLEIASSAARAAAEAAAGKIASEADNHAVPHSIAASMSITQAGGIPEKISPQALRESIMVLQDQLQHREQIIDSLEAELAKVDKDAPAKIKDRETEITWLRELLGVRIDDLEDIIKALSEPAYDREAVKDAVIRLKANLEMEQQEKERAAQSVPGGFPSMARLSSFTQTPRALPMAAAAAWGNWRKARDTSLGTLSDPANMNSQTPSRSSASPPTFLSGLLTPPSTHQRQATPPTTPPPTLAALNRRSSSEARPLRPHNGQARSMSFRQAEKRPLRKQQSSEHAPLSVQQPQQPQQQQGRPSTPPLMRESSYDQDADARRSIMSDMDDDASPVGSGLDGGGSSFGELFDESAR